MIAVRLAGRVAGSILLWVMVVVGAVSGAMWALGAAGLVRPLIVVSGSMSPAIETGDLLIATSVSPADVEVGQVVTVHSEKTGELVTHRVVEITETAAGFELRLQGDANNSVDAEVYLVAAGESVWMPRLTIPRAGFAAATLSNPAVSVPLVLALLGFCAITAFPSRRNGEDGGASAAIDAQSIETKEEEREEALV